MSAFAKMLSDLNAKKAAEAVVADVTMDNLRGVGLDKKNVTVAQNTAEREEKIALKSGAMDETGDAASDAFDVALEAQARALEEQREKKIVFDESQVEALDGIKRNRFSILIGAAGTGKTTIEGASLEEIMKWLKETHISEDEEDENAHFGLAAFCAYTGRAAQQMRKALPEKYQNLVSTIHTLLGYGPVEEEYEAEDKITGMRFIAKRRVFRPSYNAINKLPHKVIFMDESSMTPIPLWNELIAALTRDCRIVLIGDINQLPPVMGKGVLGYALRQWPVYELRHIHRQAAGNPIIANAHRVLQGKLPEAAANFSMLGGDAMPPGASKAQTFILAWIKKLHDIGRYDPYRDTIIVPQNEGLLGQKQLNEHFVLMFNPQRTVDGVIVNKRIDIHTGRDRCQFAVGDKVMQLKNINTVNPPITNGMVGIVESINLNSKYDMKRSQIIVDDDETIIEFDVEKLAQEGGFDLAFMNSDKPEENKEDQRQASHVMTVRFDNGQVHHYSTAGDYGSSAMPKISFGYACTCHKSQGGEYPTVIVLCTSQASKHYTQEWLYTALTRARKEVILLYNYTGLLKAISRQAIKGNTLAEKIRSYVLETKSDDGASHDPENLDLDKFPILWPNEEIN